MLPGGSDRRICVVMPCRDAHPGYLEEALASVREQVGVRPEDLEIVIADDASTASATLTALARADESGCRLVRLPTSRGPAAARNAAIAAGTAPFILPLDADDRVSPTFLEEARAALEAEDTTRIAYSHVRFIDAAGRTTGAVAPAAPPPSLRLKDLFAANRIVCTAMFRRDDWEALGGYDETLLRGYEDWEWWVRILATGGRAAGLPTAHFDYRTVSGSRSSSQGGEEAVAITRARILANNAAGLDVLVTAGWAAAADLQDSLDRTHAEVERWRHRTRALRWLRRRLRQRRQRRQRPE